MKRRNLLLGGISAAAIAVVGKSVSRAELEPKKVTWFEEWNSFDEATYGTVPYVSNSGYRELQIVAEQLAKQQWFQDLMREQVMREMYPLMMVMRPDEAIEYIPPPPSTYRDLSAYGYIDAPYQAKRKVAMDAKFAAESFNDSLIDAT